MPRFVLDYIQRHSLKDSVHYFMKAVDRLRLPQIKELSKWGEVAIVHESGRSLPTDGARRKRHRTNERWNVQTISRACNRLLRHKYEFLPVDRDGMTSSLSFIDAVEVGTLQTAVRHELNWSAFIAILIVALIQGVVAGTFYAHRRWRAQSRGTKRSDALTGLGSGFRLRSASCASLSSNTQLTGELAVFSSELKDLTFRVHSWPALHRLLPEEGANDINSICW